MMALDQLIHEEESLQGVRQCGLGRKERLGKAGSMAGKGMDIEGIENRQGQLHRTSSNPGALGDCLTRSHDGMKPFARAVSQLHMLMEETRVLEHPLHQEPMSLKDIWLSE